MNESSTPTPYKYAPTVPLFHSADGVCSYILAPHAADHTWLHIPFWPNEKWSALWTNGERTHVDKMSTRLLVTKSIAILCIFKGRSMVQNERRTWTSAVCSLHILPLPTKKRRNKAPKTHGSQSRSLQISNSSADARFPFCS